MGKVKGKATQIYVFLDDVSLCLFKFHEPGDEVSIILALGNDSALSIALRC